MSSGYDIYLDHCIDDHYNDSEDAELTLEDILLYYSLNDSLDSIDISGIDDYDDEAFSDMLADIREDMWRASKTF